MIRLEGVALERGSRRVLEGVDLALEAGELVALLGPNGAGKSTLMAALSGELRVSAGRLELLGRPLSDWCAAELALVRAVLPQQSRLAFSFTVLEVVTLGRSAHAGRPSQRHDRAAIRASLNAAGILRFAQRDYRQLSGGEQQRVQLARALAQVWSPAETGVASPPRLLLLDEPVASLDLCYQEQVLIAAKREARDGAAVMASLHDPNLAARHADRIVLLGEGRVLADGPPEAVLDPALLERVYGLKLLRAEHPGSGAPLVLPG